MLQTRGALESGSRFLIFDVPVLKSSGFGGNQRALGNPGQTLYAARTVQAPRGRPRGEAGEYSHATRVSGFDFPKRLRCKPAVRQEISPRSPCTVRRGAPGPFGKTYCASLLACGLAVHDTCGKLTS